MIASRGLANLSVVPTRSLPVRELASYLPSRHSEYCNCIFQINFFKKGAEMFSKSMDGFLSSVTDMVQRFTVGEDIYKYRMSEGRNKRP